MFSWDCIFEALSVPKGFADFHANLHWRSLMCCSWISFDFVELPFIDACHPPFHCVLHVNKKSYTPLIFSCKFRPAQPFTTCMCCLFWISFPPTSFRVHHTLFWVSLVRWEVRCESALVCVLWNLRWSWFFNTCELKRAPDALDQTFH